MCSAVDLLRYHAGWLLTFHRSSFVWNEGLWWVHGTLKALFRWKLLICPAQEATLIIKEVVWRRSQTLARLVFLCLLSTRSWELTAYINSSSAAMNYIFGGNTPYSRGSRGSSNSSAHGSSGGPRFRPWSIRSSSEEAAKQSPSRWHRVLTTLTRLNTFTDCIVSRASPVSFAAHIKGARFYSAQGRSVMSVIL